MNDVILKSFWGNNPVGYSYQPQLGRLVAWLQCEMPPGWMSGSQ